MNRLAVVVIAAALGLSALPALAQPPAKPNEVADSWQLESKGQILCVLRLTGRPAKGGARYGAEIPADCRAALPAGAAGWTPTEGGMALVAADGTALVSFERWSESLFVSTGAGVPDLQLSRAPVGRPGR
jgi:hypothetical protein